MGWSLIAADSITRCPKTVAEDGYKRDVKFDSEDPFCWQGERLILIDGIHGKEGAQYRTRKKNFSRIIAHGKQEEGPEYFTVETPEGKTLYFGQEDMSRIYDDKGTIANWGLSKVEDKYGNFMEYEYTALAGIDSDETTERFLSNIKYTGHNSGLSPKREVKFFYKNREQDQIKGYVNGIEMTRKKRLSRIETYVGSNLIHRFYLSYFDQDYSGKSHLMAVSQCDNSGDCLPPVRFDWILSNPGWSKNSNTLSITPPMDYGKKPDKDYIAKRGKTSRTPN